MPDAVLLDQLSVIRGDTVILDRLSARFPAGLCTAILGPNGCGKTTLTRCLTGHTFITSGSVTVLNQTIGRCDLRQLRQAIGIVNPNPGNSHLPNSGAFLDVDLSAHDLVLTGIFSTVGLYQSATPHQHEHADHLLRQVGLLHRRDLRFQLLSTGEQRRCMIARALANHPALLILDEPTAGMDVAGREQVLATIEKILAGPTPPTVIMITHHVEELSPRTAQVLLMKQGRLLAAGTPSQLITPEWLSQVFDCKVYVRRLHGRYWLEVLPEAWLDFL